MFKIYIINNIVDSYKHIPYTWKHYKAFLKVQKEILGEYRYKFHDFDKLFLYIFFPILGTKRIHKIHQRFSKHHPTYSVNEEKIYKPSNIINWTEAIIDWQCASLTKKDKPLDAYETLLKYYNSYIEDAKPYLIKYNLWRKENVEK